MEDKTKLLIAIGASFIANCQSCLKTAVTEAQKAGVVKDEEIREAIAIGRIVRKGAIGKMDKFASILTGKDVSSSDECPFGSTEEEVKEWVEQDDQCDVVTINDTLFSKQNYILESEKIGCGKMNEEDIKEIVRKSYAKMAKNDSSCCDAPNSCCQNTYGTSNVTSKSIGYSKEEIKSVSEGANLSLGCGNPVALASLKEGETVLDLGCGAGFDCFLAANKVGKDGRVIGVDMTSEMIYRARRNSRKGRYQNVEFRLGEIENLPVADGTVDVVISNCVINLSPDKKRVFEEAFRALKPGGRLMVLDIVLLRDLPESIKKNVQAYVECVAGAEMKEKYLELIEEAGFQEIKVIEETQFQIEDIVNDPNAQEIIKTSKITAEEAKKMPNFLASIRVSGIKPRNL